MIGGWRLRQAVVDVSDGRVQQRTSKLRLGSGFHVHRTSIPTCEWRLLQLNGRLGVATFLGKKLSQTLGEFFQPRLS